MLLFTVTQSEQERSCILLAQFQRSSGDWIWLHCVLQVKECSESNQQPVIVCTNQVLNEAEAAVMRTNSWLYHYYSVQNKLQYGLTYDVGPSARFLYYPEHHQSSEYTVGHEQGGYGRLSTMPTSLQQHITHHSATSHAHHNQHIGHHRRTDSEPVDYSYNKSKSKDFQNLNLEVAEIDVPTAGGTSGILVVSHISDTPRTLFKVDATEIMDQWNPSPPWSDTLQKVPDLCHQELSPYIGSTPPTPTMTPNNHSGNAFTFDWMPEQYVPSMAVVTAPAEDVNRPIYWSSEHRLFPLQPPPRRNQLPPGRSESADRDTP